MQWQSTLRIITTDDVVAAFGRPLTTTLAESAPAVTPVFQTLPADYGIERLQQGSAQLAITVDWTAPQELRRVRLYEDRFVCVVSNSHRFATHPPKPKAFAQAEHLLVAPLGGTYGPVDQRLADRGLERTIAAVVPNFLAAGPFVAAGQLVCTLPNRTAQVIAAAFELQLFDPPVALPKIRYDLFWHARFDKDPAHVWLRGLTKRIASSM